MIWLYDGPLHTARLTLRLLETRDVDDVLAWMGDPAVTRYQLYEPRDREQVQAHLAKASIARSLAAPGDWTEFGLELQGRIIGIIFFKLESVDDLTGEIGWALTKRYQGHGYAFEAATAILDLAFGPMKLRRVTAELDPRNDASVALCLRLGMRQEAHFVENLRFKGEWADTGIYAILDREWAARSR